MKRETNLSLLVVVSIAMAGIAQCAAGADGQAPLSGPKLEVVQSIKTDNEGHPGHLGINGLCIVGDYLYASARTSGRIYYYRRDLAAGQLTPAGDLDVGQRLRDAFPNIRDWGHGGSKAVTLTVASGRIYAVPADGTGMAWYNPDPKTGEPIEAGLVECRPGYHLIASPDQKDLYFHSEPAPHFPGDARMVWYHLAADGKPVKAGEVLGKGIDYCEYALPMIPPDGKQLYLLSDWGGTIACFDRKPTGELSLRDKLTEVPNVPGHRRWSSANMTPDGKRIFYSTCSMDGAERFCTYARNSDTGELSAPQPSDAPRGRHAVFLPDSSAGYWSTTAGLAAFKFDPADGHLIETSVLKDTPHTPMTLAYDAANGWLYAGSIDAASTDWIVVARAEKMAGK
jgi:6-phosphogluconolactonase (cycloisomerase 2 family)